MEICCFSGCGGWFKESQWKLTIEFETVGIECPNCKEWYSDSICAMPVRKE